MKLRKKVMSIIGACAMVTGIFASSSVYAEEDLQEITIWMSQAHSKQYWEERTEKFNNEFGSTYGVKLNLDVKIDDAYAQAIDIALQGGDVPDFFFASSARKVKEYDVAYPLSSIAGMEDLVEKYQPYVQKEFHEADGEVYSLPFGVTTRGLIYNKDMFKAAGLVDENGEATPPRTFEEVREYAKLLTDASKQEYGIVYPLKWMHWYMSDVQTLVNASSGLVNGYNPETGEYDLTVYEPILDMVAGIKEDGSYYPGAEGLDNDPARAAFATGKIGMKISFSFDVGVLNTQFPAECDWGVAPLPVANVEECYKQPAGTGASICVSKECVEKIGEEAVSAIYHYLYGDESIKELYIAGLEMPCIFDIVKDVDESELQLKGWKEFAEMAAISAISSNTMPYDLNGKEDLGTAVVNRLWTNGEEIDLEEFTTLYNDGIAAYKEVHPDIDYSRYMDENWSEKVRRDEF